MKQEELMEVARGAAAQRGCEVIGLDFNDDDNIFEITLGKTGGDVDLDDCEAVHRAVLAAFDRDVEDYALTVGSAGISGAEADALLREMEDKD